MQNTWSQYPEIQSARRSFRGRTLQTLNLLVDNLFTDEKTLCVASAEFKQFDSSWAEGTMIVSDSRIGIASCVANTQAFAQFANHASSHHLRELRSAPTGRVRFTCSAFPMESGIGLSRVAFDYLKTVMDSVQGVEVVSGSRESENAAAPAGVSPSVVTEYDLLVQLASLRDAGILNDEEFKAKKAEVLGRI